MTTLLLGGLALALAPLTSAPGAAPPTTAVSPAVEASDFDARFKSAGDDLDELWDLYLWCDAGDRSKEARKVLRKIVRLEPNHREANEALGNVYHDGQWFRSERELEKYKKKEEERVAKEKGLVRHKGEWVSQSDLAFIERGLVRDDDGFWVSPEDLDRMRKGWLRQDLEWVDPDSAANVQAGLWKCGEEWLSLEDANSYHAEFGRGWRIPSDHFHLYTTCDREVAERALEWSERAYRELVRIYGRAPERPMIVYLLRNQAQYNHFTGEREYEAGGWSSVHWACFADRGFDPETEEFWAAGVGFWDASSERGTNSGRFSVRLATGFSFAEAMDPSPIALKKSRGDIVAFYTEKQVPAWFRFGAAVFAERFFVDGLVASGGNPNWAREWSLKDLGSKGGPRPLAEFFTFHMVPDGELDALRWMIEAGAVMAYIVDGKNPELIERHGAVKEALRKGKGTEKAFLKLQEALLENEAGLRAFAGF